MMKQRTIRLLIAFFCLFVIFSPAQAYYEGSDIGYLDYVTVNGQEFDNFDERQIVFYPEDLRNGMVIVKGLLESEKKHIPVDELQVQITMDGGETWATAKGDSRWKYQFSPELERPYDFSIRVVRRDQRIEIFDDSPLGSHVADTGTAYQLGEFLLTTAAKAVEDKLTGEATLALGWLAQFVPANLKKPGTDELILQIADLEVKGKKIVNGSVVFEPDFDFDYAGASFALTRLTFTKNGASATGSIVLPPLVLPSPPEIDFSALSFSPTDINTTVPLVAADDPTKNFEIIPGVYGVSLALNELSIKINTADDIPISLASLDGSILLGSGYGGISIPNLQLLENQFLSYGTQAIAEATAAAQATGEDAVAAVQNVAGSITIPNTDFSLSDLGGLISLADKSVSLSGAFNFPAEFGGGSVSLPADKPLTLSRQGLSTDSEIIFDLGTPPTFNLSGFPTSLTALALNLSRNIPSGSLAGSVTLENFGGVVLDIEAQIDQSGLSSFAMAAIDEGTTRTLDVGSFAQLALSRVELSYESSEFSVDLDGSITPTNDLLSSVYGIGEQLAFTGLSISRDAISLASVLEGWHAISGASVGFEGASVLLSEYGLGVDNNLFWVGLKGQASLGGSSATATARIFHDGTTSVDGIDLSNIYFALGDFFLKVKGDAIDEAGAVANSTQGYIGGLPQALIDSLPTGVLNEAQELAVQLNGFMVDVANRSVSLGSVGYTPAAPFNVNLGPVTLTFAGITFTTSSASIDGSIDLDGLGLPVSDIPFADLFLGASGIAGDIDLIGDAGTRSITIVEGEYGFKLNLDTLSVNVDTRKSLASMVSLKSFGGGVLFGSAFNDLEIPDLELLADNAISWGKNSATEAQASLTRLTLPGGFAIGDLGGSINLSGKSLSIAGTIHLPAELNNASITIPAGQPVTLSAAHGLSTGGPLIFDPGTLPSIPLAGIDTILTGLSLGINSNVISGSLAGDLDFNQFGGLKIAVSAAFDSSKEGLLQELLIDADNLKKTFDLEGFASLTLKGVKGGYEKDDFYVELAGSITPTHSLFAEYNKAKEFSGLRIYKSAIEFVDDLGGWKELSNASININAASVSLEEYGLGVDNGLFWFGLKGQAEYMGGEANITAKIFHDKTYKISDFGFEGLSFSLGDFSLRTKAEMVDGLISGAGSINAGFLTEYLPREMKDPLTGELNVSFENLAVDFENKKITSGTVVLNFKKPLTPDLGVFTAVIRSVSFGSDGASVDGDFSLNSLAGVDIPQAPTNLSFADIELSPQGFAGSVTYNAGTKPVSLPVLTGDYGITLILSELTLAVDTTAVELLDKLRLTDLDGRIKLGSGYEMREELTQLTMLADQGITWGVQQVADVAEMGEAAAKQAAKNAAKQLEGLDFKIPGTEFHVNNINGRLYLNDRKLKVWGKVQLPANLGGGSIGLSETSALVLSSSGVSTTGEVDIDPGKIGKFGLAGFSADVQSFSFGVSSNAVSGSLAAKIKLAQFDNIPIDVTASLSNDGLNELTVIAADSPVGPYSLAGFADLTLTTIGGSYEDGKISIILDGDLALDPTVADVARTFSFSDLSIAKNSISMPSIDEPVMFPASLPAFKVGDSAQIALAEFGFTVKDNLLWIILGGNATILNQTVEGSILISHKGDIDLGDFRADDIVVTIGDFKLTGALAQVDGVWSGDASLYLGALHGSLDPGILNAFGELPVSVSNLVIDLERKTLTSGEISFDPEGSFTVSNDFFTASLPSVTVGVRGGSVFGEIGDGASINFDQGILAGYTEGLNFSDFGLANNGLQVTVTWANTVGKSMVIVPHDGGYNIDATLTEISVAFDSSQSELSDMFVLDGIDGNLTFGTAYNAPDLKPRLTLVEGTYTFDATDSALTLVEGLKLKDFSGAVDFSNEKITLGGVLSIPLSEGKDIAIDVSNWSISASEIAGGIAITNLDLSGPLGFGDAGSETILMKKAAIAFAGFNVSSAFLDLNVKLAQLKDLNIDAQLGVDNEGVVDFTVDVQSSTQLSADVGFADLSVKKLGAGYDSTDGLYFSLDTDVTMKQGALLGGLPSDLTLDGLEVYASKIKVNTVGVSTSFSGHKASLGGADLSLTELGLGYSSNKFYVRAAGQVTVANLCEGNAAFTLYDNGDIDMNQIAISMTNPAMTLTGDLALYSGHEVYGTGFRAELEVMVGGSLPVSGLLTLGSKKIKSGETVTGSFVWWRAYLKVGTTLSLAPLPLNIYSLGGGVGYNVKITPVAGEEPDYVATNGYGLSLTALVDLGTTDNGTSWYTELNLTVSPSDVRVYLRGESWIMEGRNPQVDPHLTVDLEIGGSPTIFHLAASIKVTKEAGGMDMVDVNGQVDVLFAANDWHVYFGSKEQPLSVTVLHYLGGQGYLQIDRSGLAMGVRKQFNLEGSAWIFYGRLYGGGEIDVAAGIQPFYVDARGKVWIGLEAGVKVSGSKYEIFSAYAELGGRFRAPPVYIGLAGKVSYSLLWGTVSGTWDMTFTYPKNPPAGAGDGGIETVPLLAYSTPEQGATDVDRFTPINIKTNVPINEIFQYDDDDKYYYLLVDNFVDRVKVPDSISVSSPGINQLPVTGGLNSTVGVQYNPGAVYPSGQQITYETILKLHEWNYDTYSIGQQVKREVVEVTFTTSSEDPSFRERVYEVYPGRSTTPVYADTDIYIVSKAIQDGEQWKANFPLEKLQFQLVNARDDIIPGTITGNLVTYDHQAGSRRFLTRFTPDEPLMPVRMVENLTTGVKAPAKKLSNGSYQNPFTIYSSVVSQANSAASQAQVATSPVVSTGSAEVVDRTKATKQMGASQTLRSGAETARGRASRGKSSRAGNGDDSATAEEEEEVDSNYRWFWDGDYKIQVVNNVLGSADQVYVSRFSLEVPAEGQDVHPYGSTADVVEASVTDPYFYVNYTVDQAAFYADMERARKEIVDTEIRTLFWENMELEPMSYPVTVVDTGSGWGAGAGTHVEWREGSVCGQYDSPYDIEGLSLPSGWGWDYIRTILPVYTQVNIYRKAMEGCESLQTQIAALEQQLEDYREESFARHSVADFRSIELRFSTAAPINWSEVALSVGVSPRFENEEQDWDFGPWSLIGIKSASSFLATEGEYIVRSEAGSLDHRLELVPEGEFNGQVMVGYLQYWRNWNRNLLHFGSLRISDKGLQQSNVVNEDGREFSVQAGRDLYYNSNVNTLRTSRPSNTSHSDGLTYEGQVYSDGSN